MILLCLCSTSHSMSIIQLKWENGYTTITMFMNVRVSHNLSFGYTILMLPNNFVGSFRALFLASVCIWLLLLLVLLLRCRLFVLFEMFITLRHCYSKLIFIRRLWIRKKTTYNLPYHPVFCNCFVVYVWLLVFVLA